jgi:hypothetical protein
MARRRLLQDRQTYKRLQKPKGKDEVMVQKTVQDIDALEKKLQEAGEGIQALFKAGKIPAPEDYADVDRIKAKLKAARRVRAMDANRTEPKLTRSYNLTFPENEFRELSERAEKRGVKLSSYIREMIKSGLKVEDEAP